MGRVGKRVPVGDVEVLEVDVVQEHIDPAQVVGGQVDLLAEEPADVVPADKIRELQQQRARAAGRIVDPVEPAPAVGGDPRQDLADLLRGEELAALARRGGVHRHEELVGVPEGVDRCVPVGQVEVADRVEQPHEFSVALGHGAAQPGGVDIDVVEEAAQVVLRPAAHRRGLNILEYPGEGLVEVLVPGGPLAHVGEQFARKDEEPLLLHEALADPLSILLRQVAVVEVRVSRLPLGAVDMVGEVLRDEPVEQEAEDVGLEVPAVHASAQVVGDLPDRPVERGALGFLAHRVGLVVVGKGYGGQCATCLRPPSPGARCPTTPTVTAVGW